MGFDDADDSTRYPGLTPAGAAMLERMREHPCAPIYRNQSGHRLLPGEIAEVQRFSAEVRAAEVDPRSAPMPRSAATAATTSRPESTGAPRKRCWRRSARRPDPTR